MIQESEHQTVDTAIIGVSGAVLASLAIILSLINPIYSLVRYSLIAAIAASGLTLLLTIWNILRYPQRSRLANAEIERLLKQMGEEIAGFADSVVAPLALKEFADSHAGGGVTGPDGKEYLRVTREEVQKDIHKILFDGLENQKLQIHHIINTYSHLMYDAKIRFLTKPLNEPFARLKLVCDLLAFRVRYFAFFFAFCPLLLVLLVGLSPLRINYVSHQDPALSSDGMTV